jgi:lycopene cyclase domain-containing protein
MTYLGVLGIFIVPPILILGIWTGLDRWRGLPIVRSGFIERYSLYAILLHCVLALVYTTPWDNYLVASGVWWYDKNLVTGLRFGYVPIEEYLLFILQPILSGLFMLTLSRYGFSHQPVFREHIQTRWIAASVGIVLWVFFVGMLLSRWVDGRYLSLIMVWALIPLIIQLAFGADILWSRRKFVLFGILIPSVYLNSVDTMAIDSGTWIISSEQTTGLRIDGTLPMEEMIFFTITNMMVVCGMTLMLAPESYPRLNRFWEIVASAKAELWKRGNP